jgi:hypothetical protein
MASAKCGMGGLDDEKKDHNNFPLLIYNTYYFGFALLQRRRG